VLGAGRSALPVVGLPPVPTGGRRSSSPWSGAVLTAQLPSEHKRAGGINDNSAKLGVHVSGNNVNLQGRVLGYKELPL